MGEKNISETKLILRFANGVNEQNEPVYKDVKILLNTNKQPVKSIKITL